MALTVGELVAYAQIDKSDFQRGTKAIAADLKALQSETSSSMAGMEGSVVRSLADIERAIADGLDPAEAIRDLDRLEKALDDALDGMLGDTDRWAAELESAVDEAFASLDDDAKESGRRAGKELAAGLEDGVDDAVAAAKRVLAELDAELDQVDGRDVDVDVNVDTKNAKGAIDGLGEAAVGVGGKLGSSLSVIGNVGPGQVAIVAGAIAALPTVAGVAASGIVAALGGGLLAVGLKAAATSDQVRHAWSEATDKIKAGLADAAQPLEESAIHAADVAEKTFNKLKPSLKRIFRDMVPDVDFFVDKVGEGVRSLGPTLEKLGDGFGDILHELGTRMPAIIGNIDASLRTLTEILDEHPEMLADLVEDATELLKAGAEVLSWADEIKVAFSAPLGPAGSQEGTDYFMRQMFGGSVEEIRAAMEQLPLSMATMKTTLATSALALQDVGSEGNDAARGVRNLNSALEELFDPAAAALDAEIRLRDAIKDAAEAAKDHKMSTVDRLKGVQDLTGAIADAAKAESERTGKTKESSEAFLNNLGHLTEWAGKNDAAKATISALGDSLGITTAKTKGGIIAVDGFGHAVKVLPNGKVVKIDADSAEAKKALGETKKKVDDVKDKKVKVDADTKKAVDEVGKVTKKLGDLKGDGTKAGQDLGSGLVAGIRSMLGDAAAAAKSLASSALQAAKNFLGIKSPSTEMAEVGKWTAKGLIQGLTSEEGNVKSTIEKMVETVKAAFKSQPDVAEGLLVFIRQGNKNLEDLALQREALVQKLADAKEMAKKVAGTAEEWANITGLKAEDIAGAGDLANELKSKAHAINDFANNIKELSRRGLNKKIIQDIIDAGVEKGATWAEMLVGSDGSEIKALNKAQAAVDKASKKLGKASADAMFDTGKKAGEGYLKGLQESLKALDKEMKKIVDALVKAIKKELKIKSPSQVMAEIGEFTMAGFVQGMQAMTSAVQGAAQMVVTQAVAGAQAAAGGGPVASLGSLGTMAGRVGRQGATAGLGLDGYTPPPAQTAAPAAGGVTVHMYDTTIREELDVTKTAREFGFQVAVQA